MDSLDSLALLVLDMEATELGCSIVPGDRSEQHNLVVAVGSFADIAVEVSIVAGLPNCHVQQNREIVLEVSHYKSLGSFGAVVTASIGVDQLVVVDCIELVEKLPPLDCC